MKIFHTALEFDYFRDVCSSRDRVINNKFVISRKPHKCHWCKEDINIGEKYRYMVAKYDGELMTFKWCPKCCEAMETVLNGDEETVDAYENRYKK